MSDGSSSFIQDLTSGRTLYRFPLFQRDSGHPPFPLLTADGRSLSVRRAVKKEATTNGTEIYATLSHSDFNRRRLSTKLDSTDTTTATEARNFCYWSS